MDKHNTLIGLIQSKIAEDNGKGITFIEGEKDEISVSYIDLYSRALCFLYYLQMRNIKRGDQLIFQIDDNESFVYTFWACLLGGIIPVPVSVGHNDEHRLKLFRIWRILKNPALVCDEKTITALSKFASGKNLSDTFETIKNKTILIDEIKNNQSCIPGTVYEPAPEDIAFIQFSSGSTGDPKGVVLTHANLLANTEAIMNGACVREDEKVLSWMPLTHDMGLIGFHLMSTLADVNQYLMRTSLFIAHPTLWFDKASAHRANVLYSPNFGFKHLMAFYDTSTLKDWDLSGLRVIFNGAEPISAEQCNIFLEKMAQFGLKRNTMLTCYGLAEASVAVAFPIAGEEFSWVCLDRNSLNIGEPVKEVGSEHKDCVTFVEVGYPVDYCSIRICLENNNIVDENTIGYIQIKGRNVTSGYYNNPEATARVMTEDGWLNTGDLGFMKKGRLVITGRAKDIIFLNGQNYYPHDIERVVENVYGDNIRYVAACGAFNKELQKEEIILCVMFKKKLEEFIPLAIDMKRLIMDQMGLSVREVLPVRNMPRTTSGKIQRYKLAEQYLSGEYDEIIEKMNKLIDNMQSPEHGVCTSDTEKKLTEICRGVFDRDRIGINDNFLEFGGESILLTKVQSEIEKLYPHKVTVTDFFAYPTISKLAKLIEGNQIKALPAAALPKDYFTDAGTYGENSALKFRVEGELFEKLLSISKNGGPGIKDVLLGLYVYLLSASTGNKRVAVQTMLDIESHAVSLSVDLSHITDFGSLFKLISQEQRKNSSSDAYQLQELPSIRFSKEEASVIPFVYLKGLYKQTQSLLDTYDIVLEIMEANTHVFIVCEFNTGKLKKEKMIDHINQYAKLIEMVVNQYESSIKECV